MNIKIQEKNRLQQNCRSNTYIKIGRLQKSVVLSCLWIFYTANSKWNAVWLCQPFTKGTQKSYRSGEKWILNCRSKCVPLKIKVDLFLDFIQNETKTELFMVIPFHFNALLQKVYPEDGAGRTSYLFSSLLRTIELRKTAEFLIGTSVTKVVT